MVIEESENSVNEREENLENEQSEDVSVKEDEVNRIVLDVQQCGIGYLSQLPEDDVENGLTDEFKEITRKRKSKLPPDKIKTSDVPLIKKLSFLTFKARRMWNYILYFALMFPPWERCASFLV